MNQPGLFDWEERLKSLSKCRDPLEKIKEGVDFEVFREEMEKELNFSNRSRGVWGDTAYRSEENEEFLREHGLTSKLHRKKPKGKPMPQRTERANGKKSKT